MVDQIQEAILEGKLKQGDRLPAERELTELFKTSRGTLREALRVLEQKGLIEIKIGAGGGALVKKVTTDQMSENLALLIRCERVSLDHLAEFREGVEGLVAELAAERATKKDIAALRALLGRARQHLEEGVHGWNGFIRVDQSFHRALAHISGNPVYIYVLQTVHENIHRYYEKFLPGSKELMKKNYNDLSNIVRAIEHGRSHEARVHIQDHIRCFRQHMEGIQEYEKE